MKKPKLTKEETKALKAVLTELKTLDKTDDPLSICWSLQFTAEFDDIDNKLMEKIHPYARQHHKARKYEAGYNSAADFHWWSFVDTKARIEFLKDILNK